MKLGNPSQFAVEFELDDSYGGEWLYGKFCYWVNGKCIGDYELGTSLRDILFMMTNVLRDKGNRSHHALFCLEKTELFRRLNEALFGYEISQYYETANDECWARFNITLPVDVFDNWKVFLIEGKETARIIYRNPDTEDAVVHEEFIAPGEFDEIIEDAYKALDSYYCKETGVNGVKP
ncbi:MAG: hypothetical protein GY795_41860 [Desulfobacterales bacterium]|nr:hypothetical protein [Desulfobacterales bacterium]